MMSSLHHDEILALGWVETEFEMTSVTSTREVRPVPKMLLEMVRDPTSLPVMYHGASKQGKDTPIQVNLYSPTHNYTTNIVNC